MSDEIIRHPADADTDEMQVVLVRASDGQRRVILPSWKNKYTWEDEFWWTEGNFGCDCNRRDAFADASDEPRPDADECSHHEYSVILRTPPWRAAALDREALVKTLSDAGRITPQQAEQLRRYPSTPIGGIVSSLAGSA